MKIFNLEKNLMILFSLQVTRDSDDDSSDTYGISDEEQEERIAVR